MIENQATHKFTICKTHMESWCNTGEEKKVFSYPFFLFHKVVWKYSCHKLQMSQHLQNKYGKIIFQYK